MVTWESVAQGHKVKWTNGAQWKTGTKDKGHKGKHARGKRDTRERRNKDKKGTRAKNNKSKGAHG